MIRALYLVLVILFAFMLNGCVIVTSGRGGVGPQATAVQNDTIPIQAGDGISVRTTNGGVSVITDPSLNNINLHIVIGCAGDDDEEAGRRLRDSYVSVSRRGCQLHFEPVFAGGKQSGDYAKIEIRTPIATSCTVDNDNGAVYVSGIGGRVTLTTTNGAVGVQGCRGPLLIETTNGAVSVSSHTGAATVRTTNGEVISDRCQGSLNLRTTNGDITVVNGPPRHQITTFTRNGDVSIVGAD